MNKRTAAARWLGVFVVLINLPGFLAAEMRLSASDPETFRKSALSKYKKAAEFLASMPACSAANRNECPRFYLSGDQRYGLVEMCLQSKEHAPGIYLFHPNSEMIYYKWYDDEFNAWSCAEGCSEKSECYYTAPPVTGKGQIKELEYHYHTNLTHGSYKLKASGRRLEVIEKKSEEDPS